MFHCFGISSISPTRYGSMKQRGFDLGPVKCGSCCLSYPAYVTGLQVQHSWNHILPISLILPRIHQGLRTTMKGNIIRA